jgi:hypothetical protein
VLNHAIRETRVRKVNALVFVGDAMEEKVDRLCRLAGELGLLVVPIFLFQEGRGQTAAAAFKQIATLSRGAYLSHFRRYAPKTQVRTLSGPRHR